MNTIFRKVLASILIVEDEEDHARLITKSLLDSGTITEKFIHLKNGEEALNYLKKEKNYIDDDDILPSLILLDIKMPMKNGFEVLEELKNDNRLRKIPVVMLTTTSTTEDINKAMSLGANDYIVKPVQFSEFTEKVKRLGYYWGAVSDSGKIFV